MGRADRRGSDGSPHTPSVAAPHPRLVPELGLFLELDHRTQRLGGPLGAEAPTCTLALEPQVAEGDTGGQQAFAQGEQELSLPGGRDRSAGRHSEDARRSVVNAWSPQLPCAGVRAMSRMPNWLEG
jgi:hypothetical protein